MPTLDDIFEEKPTKAVPRTESATATIEPPSSMGLMDVAAGLAPPGMAEIEPPNAMARMGRGMMDVYQGGKQKYLNWINPEEAARYTQERNADLTLYEQGRGPDAGFDWMRLAGGAATPLSLIPGGAASLGGRMALGALAGGTTGYTLYNPENTPESNLNRTAMGAGAGAILAAIVPPAIDLAIKGGQRVVGKLSDVGHRALQNIVPSVRADIERQTKSVLSQQGVHFDRISKDVQQSILDDAAEQLSVNGQLNAEALARRATIETVTGKGMATKAQITRDPAQWTLERNLQKTEANIPAVQRGEVPTITGRLQQQDTASLKFSKELTDTIAGQPAHARAQTPLQASERAITALQKADEKAERVVTDLYQSYHEMGVHGAHVPDTKLAETLGRVADDYGIENIPSAVLARLKEFGLLSGQRTKLLTVQEADKLNRLINNNNPGFGPASKALGILKQTLNESLLDVPIDGQAGVKSLMTARQAAAERFAAQKSTKAIEEAIGGTPPDRFFEKYILRGNVGDIKTLGSKLRDVENGNFAWNDLRTQTWQWIVEKATQRGRQPISGARLDDALKNIGKDRLNVLFNPAERSEIETLRQAALAMTSEPAHAAVNRSNTASSLLGQVLRFANKIPGANVLTQPIEQQVQASTQQKILSEALRGGSASIATRNTAQDALRMKMLNPLAGRMNMLAPLGSQTANLLTIDPNRQ